MRILLAMLMACLLLRAPLVMEAAAGACRLFVTSVLPGLFPYMTLSLLLTSRFAGRLPPWLFLLMGWGGGSPTGARLLPMVQGGHKMRIRLAVSCATMSPMFLLGTVGAWLSSSWAGGIALAGMIASGALTGALAGCCCRDAPEDAAPVTVSPLSFGAAVESAARTMLLVCGTMVMLRVFAALAGDVLPPEAVLPVTTLLEVTTGTRAIAELPWPLPLRTAVIAGAVSFGGMAVIMQNRAVYDAGFMPLAGQVAWQAVHGALAFLITLGMMLMVA